MNTTKEALAIARELNNKNVEIIVMSNMSGSLVDLGDYKNAENQLRNVIERMEKLRTFFYFPKLSFFLAQTTFYQNNSEALTFALRSLDLSKKAEFPTGIGCAWRIPGMISAQNKTSGGQSAKNLSILRNVLPIPCKFLAK